MLASGPRAQVVERLGVCTDSSPTPHVPQTDRHLMFRSPYKSAVFKISAGLGPLGPRFQPCNGCVTVGIHHWRRGAAPKLRFRRLADRNGSRFRRRFGPRLHNLKYCRLVPKKQPAGVQVFTSLPNRCPQRPRPHGLSTDKTSHVSLFFSAASPRHP